MTKFDMKFKATKYIEEEIDCLDEFYFELESSVKSDSFISYNCYKSLVEDAYSRIIGALHISRTLEIISLEEYNNYTKDAISKYKKVVSCILENSNKSLYL